MNKQQKKFLFSAVISALLIFLVFSLTAYTSKTTSPVTSMHSTIHADALTHEALHLYESLDLDKLGLSRQALLYALKGYKKLQEKGQLANDAILSVIDFSLPSTQKRFFCD